MKKINFFSIFKVIIMYSDIVNDLTVALFSCRILNIYTSDEKLIIGIGGVPKEDVEFNAFGIVIQYVGKKVWYSFDDIKKIEVY